MTRYSDPEKETQWRAKISRAVKEACSRPTAKKNSLEYKKRRSRIAKEIWSRPGYKERQIKSQREAHSKPEVKEKDCKAAKEVHSRPEVRAKLSKSAKEAHARPEVKEKHRKAVKEACARPGYKENHPNWKGGISFKPYCHKFNDQLKDEIRVAFGYKCYLCPHIQNGRKLSIHHVDYNKNDICNGRKWPLIPLCPKCHGKTNHNRWYWFNLLMNYWAMSPEINLSTITAAYPMTVL